MFLLVCGDKYSGQPHQDRDGSCGRSPLQGKTFTLTSHVKELREGLHWHELFLEGLQSLVSSFVDGHVVVANVFR